jgi:hypothetical protein
MMHGLGNVKYTQILAVDGLAADDELQFLSHHLIV